MLQFCVFMHYLQEHGSLYVHWLLCASVGFSLGLELELGILEMEGGHRTGRPDFVMGGDKHCSYHLSCGVIEMR